MKIWRAISFLVNLESSKLYPMKNILFYAALLLCAAFPVACSHTSSSNQSVGNVSQQEHITLGHIEATAIQDNATPHFMPVTLFPDAGDSLITALDLNDGIPSSMISLSLYPAYRNNGIGSQLLNSMLDLLKNNGVKKVSLSVSRTNRAVSLYKRFGFEIIDRDRDLTTADYLMQRYL